MESTEDLGKLYMCVRSQGRERVGDREEEVA